MTALGMAASRAAMHPAIGRLAARPDVVRRSVPRGPLRESDRGADKVPFGKLDAAIAQNVVSGRVMKIEVG